MRLRHFELRHGWWRQIVLSQNIDQTAAWDFGAAAAFRALRGGENLDRRGSVGSFLRRLLNRIQHITVAHSISLRGGLRPLRAESVRNSADGIDHGILTLFP